MKQIKHNYSKAARSRGFIKVCVWVFLLCSIGFFHHSSLRVGPQPVYADVRYGIQGRQAPELNLKTWVDGDGKPIDPIKLSRYRGKVIYLYFFQDW